MTREQLEHIVRAAGAIADEQKILVLGSQSILGSFPQPPEKLTVSREADVCPLRDPSKADLISGAIGEISQFDSTFGYYAHGLPRKRARRYSSGTVCRPDRVCRRHWESSPGRICRNARRP